MVLMLGRYEKMMEVVVTEVVETEEDSIDIRASSAKEELVQIVKMEDI